MDDKTFALLEKLYVEMMGLRTELKDDIQGLRTELKDDIQGLRTELNDKIDGVRSEMATKSDLARMEHDNAQKFGALFDGLSANTEAIHELKVEVQALKKEVENHEIKLKLVK